MSSSGNTLDLNTVTAHCLNCGVDQRIQNAEVVATQNNRQMVKGKCPGCGAGLNKLLPHDR